MPALVNAPTRKVRTMIMDSQRWTDFSPRAGDVIVATYPKCGTTWTQRIVSMLIHGSPAPRDIMGEGPWVDATIFDPIDVMLGTLNGQHHRRSMKSHLPLDALPVFDGAKVVHTVRDGRDACTSMHNHMLGMLSDRVMARMAPPPAELMADGPPPPTPEDPREWFLQWMETAEGKSAAARHDTPFCEFELSYWAARHEPWLLHVHYADLKADLPGEIRRISEFLEIDTSPARLQELAAAATFDAMKRDGDALLPKLRESFDKGPDRFLNKGTNGRWKDFLTPEDLARYDALIHAKLSPDMARWIESGRLVAGDPRELGDGPAVRPS